MIDHGALVDAKNLAGKTVLHLAAVTGIYLKSKNVFTKILDSILKNIYHFNPNTSINVGNEDIVRILFIARATPSIADNAERKLISTSYRNIILLKGTIKSNEGELRKIVYLYELFRVPIHAAAERGYTDIVNYLADKFKASIYERTGIICLKSLHFP